MLWYRYWQVPGRQYRLPLGDSRGAHVSKELSYGKDGPQCREYGFSCVEWLCAERPVGAGAGWGRMWVS